MIFFKLVIYFIPICIFSQSNLRFTFQYNFASNIMRKDSLITNYMNLDTNGNESNFYNVTKYRVDSIKKTSNNMLAIINAGKLDKNLHYNILKNYTSKDVIYSTKFTSIDLKIPETEIPSWQLSKEIKIIGNWKCQKAETIYKGRKWIAYFTKDIPINDGPYKFWGLPGFIVEIFDDEKLHHFSLIQIKKIETPHIVYPPKNAKLISYEKYQEYLKNYKPSISDVEAISINNGISTYLMKDGSRVNINVNSETLRKYENNREELERIILNKISEPIENPIEK